jgi:hypothetical protein
MTAPVLVAEFTVIVPAAIFLALPAAVPLDALSVGPFMEQAAIQKIERQIAAAITCFLMPSSIAMVVTIDMATVHAYSPCSLNRFTEKGMA